MPYRSDPSVQALQNNAREAGAASGFVNLAAAGATQGTATQIPDTASVIIVTTTLSSEGVKLPTAATGKRVTVVAMSAKGVKVYPFTDDRIQGAASNVAVALVLNKTSQFLAVDAVNWRVFKGS